jgi:hypothetical protein
VSVLGRTRVLFVRGAAGVRMRKEREPAELSRQALQDRGGQTSIEPWIERFRVEFCLSAPPDFDLMALEVFAA